MRFVLLVVLVLAIPACETDREVVVDATTGEGPVSAANGDSPIPLPEGTRITGRSDNVLMFRPEVSYPEAVAFFSRAFSSGGWTLVRERIPDDQEGERTAHWEVTGHGLRVRLDLTAFGGPQGSNMTGLALIEER